jgi:hypothetical protein
MKHPVGELRRSQAIHTFGIGSAVDLPHLTAITMGLEYWSQPDWDPTSAANAISEERLLAIVRSFPGCYRVQQLTAPPTTEDDDDGSPVSTGIPIDTFPRWVRCPRCELLAPLDFGVFRMSTNPYKPGETKFIHENCPKASRKAPTVNPVRFVFACKNGHLADFPWHRFMQTAKNGCAGRLDPCGPYRLQERGVSSEVADLFVRCDKCEARRAMTEAFGEDAPPNLGPCSRRHPHLGSTFEDDECQEGEPRAMLLGASNQWFAMILSALTIPSGSGRLVGLIDKHWPILQKLEKPEELGFARKLGQLQSFTQYTDDEIWKQIEVKRGGQSSSGGPRSTRELKAEEWEVFSRPDQAPRPSEDFEVQRRQVPRRYEDRIADVVAVPRLRMVKALVGFTRIDSPGDYSDLSEVPDVQRVRLGRSDPSWVPAFEVRGEGIFLRLREEAIASWRSHPAVRAREEALRAAHRAFRASRGIEAKETVEFDVLRFTLLHTLSHALIRQFSVECGYSAASIQERLYSAAPNEEGGPMAGVLLLTAAADSEGTLGGLVSLSEPSELRRHIDQALERARLCSSDPLCSEHSPDREGRDLHGAACHACSFVSETSCERGNKYLDRSLLVDTIGGGVPPFFNHVDGTA